MREKSPSAARHDWIVLDTSVVHETVRGNATLGIDLAELATLRRSTPVSLSQTTYVELTNQLAKQNFTFEQWRPVALALSGLIDSEHPVLPQSTALRAMLGTASCDEAVRNEIRGLRAMWHVLKTARTPEDLKEGRRYSFEGDVREFRVSAIRGELDRREQEWAATFEHVVTALKRPAAPKDRQQLADGIREAFGAGDVAAVPELESAVQLAAEWLVLHGRQYEKGQGYKPKLNDAMDFVQLFVLGLPATICTSDKKLIDRVRALGTPGSDRVMTPTELLEDLRAR